MDPSAPKFSMSLDESRSWFNSWTKQSETSGERYLGQRLPAVVRNIRSHWQSPVQALHWQRDSKSVLVGNLDHKAMHSAGWLNRAAAYKAEWATYAKELFIATRSPAYQPWHVAQKPKFTKEELEALDQRGMSVLHGFIYDDLNLAITPESLPAGVGVLEILEALSLPAAGSFKQEVFLACTREKKSGEIIRKRIFKPQLALRDRMGLDGHIHGHLGAQASGVSGNAPEEVRRNVDAYKVAVILGFPVVPHSEWAVDVYGRPGLSMAYIEGYDLVNFAQDERFNDLGFKKKVLNQALFRKRLVELQLLDALVGQVDRHAGNIMINLSKIDYQVTGVWGIDNDVGFGKAIRHGDDVALNWADDKRGRYMRGVKMPQVIDMAQFVSLVQPELWARLNNALAKTLAADEQQALQERLICLQQHAYDLFADGKVIDPEDWVDQDDDAGVSGGSVVAKLMASAEHSYWGRFLADVEICSEQRSGMR